MLLALVESRKMEVEIYSEFGVLISPESKSKVKNDLAKWNELLKKIKNEKK